MAFKNKLSSKGESIFTTMSALAAKEDAINLSQGFPDFPIDMDLKKKVIEALAAEQVQYAPMPGRLDLRQEISAKILAQHKVTINPIDEITVTSGATQAIYSAITAVVHSGDEVIVFDPAYDCYDPTIKLNGGIPVHIELDFPSYGIDWVLVKKHVNDNTRLIVINNPHNPTGSVLSKNDLDQLENIIADFPNLYILSDEVYEHMQYNGTHCSIVKRAKLFSRSFVTYSFGKTFHVTGWKLGYAIAPKGLTDALRAVHQFQVFCVNNTMQYAIAMYLKTNTAWASISGFYKDKRDLLLSEMKGSRFVPLACDGTYFVLFDYSAISSDSDVIFSRYLTMVHKVATIPISVFYENKKDHKVLRICFAKEDETIIKAAKILKLL